MFHAEERVESHVRGEQEPIWPRLLLSVILGGLLTVPCAAQILPPSPPIQQPSPQLQVQPSPQPAAQEVAPITGTITAPAQTPTVLPGTMQSSTVKKSFGSVGRGLPGMPGGPPLNGGM